MVDDEVELRPILCGLADISDIGKATQMWKLFLNSRREQPLVDADVLDSQFARALPERIRVLFVVEPVGARAIIVSLSMNSSLM